MLKKKYAFTNLKKYATLYAMLQILPQVNILKECQHKSEALPPCTNWFEGSMRLPYVYILNWKALENPKLLLNDLVSHWHFYRPRPSQDADINEPVWED